MYEIDPPWPIFSNANWYILTSSSSSSRVLDKQILLHFQEHYWRGGRELGLQHMADSIIFVLAKLFWLWSSILYFMQLQSMILIFLYSMETTQKDFQISSSSSSSCFKRIGLWHGWCYPLVNLARKYCFFLSKTIDSTNPVAQIW